MRRIFGCLFCLALCGCIVLCNIITIKPITCIEEKSAIMDLVSTVSINGEEKLVIVSNYGIIEDKVEFAGEILKNYINNSFQTIKLSDDINSEVSYLEAEVYLGESKMRNGDCEMEIAFKPKESKGKYNIRDNPEQFDVYINDIKQKDIWNVNSKEIHY